MYALALPPASARTVSTMFLGRKTMYLAPCRSLFLSSRYALQQQAKTYLLNVPTLSSREMQIPLSMKSPPYDFQRKSIFTRHGC